MSQKPQQPKVLQAVAAEVAKEKALTESQVIEALRIGHKERVEAEARVPRMSLSSRNRFRIVTSSGV